MSSMTEDCDTGIYRGVAPKPHNSNTQTTKTKDCHAQTQRNIRGGAERRIKIDGERKFELLNHTQSFPKWRPSRVATWVWDAWSEFPGCASFPLFLWRWHGPTAAEQSSNSSIQFPASLVNEQIAWTWLRDWLDGRQWMHCWVGRAITCAQHTFVRTHTYSHAYTHILTCVHTYTLVTNNCASTVLHGTETPAKSKNKWCL